MDISISIKWTSPFPNLGVSGVLFHFCFVLNRTVYTRIRCCILPMSHFYDTRYVWVKHYHLNWLYIFVCAHFVCVRYRVVIHIRIFLKQIYHTFMKKNFKARFSILTLCMWVLFDNFCIYKFVLSDLSLGFGDRKVNFNSIDARSCTEIYEPEHNKTKMTCTPREDSAQPRHPPGLISLCCVLYG